MKVEKKCWPDWFEKIYSGEKNFEIRLADFDVSEGDILVLREWDPKTKDYTGRQIEKKVTFVAKMKDLTNYWPKEEIEKYGFHVIGLK